MVVRHREEVFFSAILGYLTTDRRFATDVGPLIETGTLNQREIGHGIDAVDTLFV